MGDPVPSHAKFEVVLSKVIKNGTCPSVIKDAKCEFSYEWNFSTNMGSATLHSIDGAPFPVTLNALGIEGMLGFMSDMQPTHVVVKGQSVVVNLVGLYIYLDDGERAAFIKFNEDGSCVVGTDSLRPEAVAELG